LQLSFYVKLEGAPWLKHSEGILPRKFSMKHMKPLPRAWAWFLVQTLQSFRNIYEFRLVRDGAVQAIMKG